MVVYYRQQGKLVTRNAYQAARKPKLVRTIFNTATAYCVLMSLVPVYTLFAYYNII